MSSLTNKYTTHYERERRCVSIAPSVTRLNLGSLTENSGPTPLGMGHTFADPGYILGCSNSSAPALLADNLSMLVRL